MDVSAFLFFVFVFAFAICAVIAVAVSCYRYCLRRPSSCTIAVLFYSCMFGSSEVASGRARACMFWMSDYYANYYT